MITDPCSKIVCKASKKFRRDAWVAKLNSRLSFWSWVLVTERWLELCVKQIRAFLYLLSLGVQNLKILISDLDLCALLKYTSMLVAAYCIARLFSFVMTNGPTTKETGSEDLLEVVYHKVRSPCISQGCQVGHNWCEFKIFSLQVLRNVLLKNKYLRWHISLKSNCWYKFEMP